MKCSRCGKDASSDEREYLNGSVVCEICVDNILEKFFKIFKCRISRSTCGYCLELEDIHWLVITAKTAEGMPGYIITDIDREIKEGVSKKDA
ncbi:MAG: hypothetical protein ACW99G_19300 [Candidatus Thorarchaeota archaeon]|jgi:hypothetical protein